MKQSTILIIIAVILITVFIFRKKINKVAKFDLIMNVILAHEGGYVNHPADPGGETKYGIAKKFYPDLDIKNLTKAQAVEIYRRDFYNKMGIEQISDLNLALNVMDMGVNAGTSRAMRMLGEAADIAAKQNRDIVKVYKELRVNYYKALAEKKPELKVFLAGWLNRVKTSSIA